MMNLKALRIARGRGGGRWAAGGGGVDGVRGGWVRA